MRSSRRKPPAIQFLVPTDPHYAGRIYIQCPAFISGAPESYGCEANIYLGHFVYGQYRFSYTHLGDWKKKSMLPFAPFLKPYMKPEISEAQNDVIRNARRS